MASAENDGAGRVQSIGALDSVYEWRRWRPEARVVLERINIAGRREVRLQEPTSRGVVDDERCELTGLDRMACGASRRGRCESRDAMCVGVPVCSWASGPIGGIAALGG
jgi:hypothetical protein